MAADNEKAEAWRRSNEETEQRRQMALRGPRDSLAMERRIDIWEKESQRGHGCLWGTGVLPCTLGKS